MSQPVFHYLDLGRLGRGEVVRLFLKDAGVDFKDIRYPYDATWPAASEDLKKKGITLTGKLPVIEYKGKILGQHIPILRYFSRELGSYEGDSNFEKYVVDAVSDLYIDWRVQWVASLKGVTDEYKNKIVPDYYNLVSRYYAERGGPYLLGDKITYADFAIYQSIDNDERTGTLPTLPENLVKLRKAFEQRPRIAEYIASGRNSKV
ncbi:glutathione S-transferase [Talaromyces proteolyticus]|uniref:Glutathione S-transferase n=1 Tax=Talaromyces proteolyticus TaxID=1131652 RepID=A0AAD4KSQ0_9EURO|nr:glutathione S-transferase [Talaromyces proteolyticus]KAH8698468.1 glutathione S-transferase [Talaromyces proteolyticus]